MISVYSKKTEIELNIRRLESIEKYNRIIQWGRANPVQFIDLVFKITLIDYQKYVFLNTWTTEHAAWVCSRNGGKTFLLAVYTMARNLLFPSFMTYIMSYTGFQSRETFMKIENIVKKNIASLVGSSDVFANETVKNNSNKDGFTHGSSNYEVELYNGSKITSLVGKAVNIVGMRSNLNVYDEAGKISDDFFALTKPFTTQNIDFKTGEGFDERVYPMGVPTQNIYASSAENVETHLWKQYSDCYKNMMMGIPGFFCADINCEMPLKPYINGIAAPALLKQTEIDSAMRTNEAKALREYYNIFDTSGGSDAAVQRSVILRNEFRYLPYNCSASDDKHYVLLYDPALQADNSFVLIAEMFRDKEKGWKARIINGINLIERISPTETKPLRTPEQLDWLRKLIVAYNGNNVEYSNIHVYIDAGPGGAGRQYGDLLMMDWRDANGVEHRGIIDESDESSMAQRPKYPHAVNRLRLMEPTKFKPLMYGALSEMMQQDLIEMPISIPNNGIMELEDGTKRVLTSDEVRAMVEIDLTKEEVMAIQKTKTVSGLIQYKLPANKERKYHDDRAYCLAMLGWHLSEIRREERASFEVPKANFEEYFKGLSAQERKASTFQGRTNPFASKGNPFAR